VVITASAIELYVYRSYLPAVTAGALFQIAGSWSVYQSFFAPVAKTLFEQVG
jgi:hypothetical protein